MLEKENTKIKACELNDDDLENISGGASKKQNEMEEMCPYCETWVASSALEYHIRQLHGK